MLLYITLLYSALVCLTFFYFIVLYFTSLHLLSLLIFPFNSPADTTILALLILTH